MTVPPAGYRVMPVSAPLGASAGTWVLHLLGVVANIVLLCGAAILVIYTHQQLGWTSLLGLDPGTHTVSRREVGWTLLVSIGCHALLGLTVLIAYRSRYRLRSAALALSSASWGIWLIGYSVGLAALVYSNGKPFVLKQGLILGGGAAWAAINVGGAAVFALARRASLKPASTIAADSPGRYFVYLRSFVSDAEKSPDRSPLFYFASLGTAWLAVLFNPFYLVDFRRQSPEEIILLKGMGRTYPVVAIGQPGEEVPPLGASRVYVEHDRWKQVATSLADHACAVLLLPHSTAGVVWEFTELCLRTHPSKAVIILPHSLASLHWGRNTRITHHADLWRKFLAALKHHPMARKLPAALPSNALVMTFGDDWSPIVWVGAPTTANFNQVARYVALNAVPS